MNKALPIILVIFLSGFNSYGQIAYYDALYLKAHLSGNSITSTISFNRKEDSLKKVKGSLDSAFQNLRALTNPPAGFNRADSIQKYGRLGQINDSVLKVVQSQKDDSLFSVLKRYFPQIDSTSSSDTITAIIQRNPYFAPYSVRGTVRAGGGAHFFQQLVNGTGGIAGSIGGLDVTNLVNGITQFMIKRAKQELTIAFFEKFKQFADANPEFGILFPKTVNNLENLLSFHYPEMLNVLRTGFMDDLSQLVFHVDGILTLPRYQKLLKDLPEIKIAIRSIRLVQELQDHTTHPADILNEFDAFPEWKDASASNNLKNFGGSIHVANLLAQSLRSTDTLTTDSLTPKRAWITLKQMQDLIADNDAFTFYMGLLYQEAKKKGIQFFTAGGTVDFFTILEKQKDNIFLVQTNLVKFIQLTEQLQNTLQDIANKKKSKIALTNDDYYNYINTGINVIEFGFDIARYFDKDLDIGAYTKLARQADDLYRNVYQKQYSQAITNTITILQEIIGLIKAHHAQDAAALNAKLVAINSSKNTKLGVTGFLKAKPASIDRVDEKDQKDIKAMLDATNAAVASGAAPPLTAAQVTDLKDISAAAASRDSLGKLTGILDKLSKYGLFIANMANASTPDEVSDILENTVLPVGSSSIKKDAIWNFSVQSYLGVYRLTSKPNPDLNVAWTGKYGMFAPIGLSFGHGLKDWGYVSLFAPLLDIGAIVDYQLKYDSLTSDGGRDSAISRDYKIKLGQIISPGLYLVYGFPWKLPLAAGFGAQYGPGLSKVNIDGTSQVNNPAWRWNVFLTVDIPFFTIWNKPRTKK